MHSRFVFTGGGAEGVSFHYVVDDHELIELVPDDEVAGTRAMDPSVRVTALPWRWKPA